MRPDTPTVVSVYAPITFPTAGVLLFKQREDGKASGLTALPLHTPIPLACNLFMNGVMCSPPST